VVRAPAADQKVWEGEGTMATMMRLVLATVVFVLSVGWLIPMWFGVGMFFSWCMTEVNPHINGQEAQLNSFPLLATANSQLRLAILWMGLVVLVWAGYLCVRFIVFRAKNSATSS
jgi:hypothetical protein